MIKIEIRHSILALKMDKGSIQNTTKFKIDNLLGLGEKYDQFTTYYLSNCYTIWCVLHWKLDTAVFMFVLLTTGIVNPRFIQDGSSYMVKHLVLFFIPTTVGVINFYHLFVGKGILLIVITIISSLLVMISAGYTSQFLAKGKEQEQAN